MHELGQVIWYIMDNRVHSAPVLARMIVDNLSQDKAHTQEQKKIYMPFGEEGIYYHTVHGLVTNREAYGSKKDLLDSL